MAKWKIYTPEGVQDILTDDCYAKRNLEANLRVLFRRCAYQEVETPTIEFYDVFSAEPGLTPQETMFKFFDQQGRILVLRPDITIPVVRMAATKYKDVKGPLRVFYIGNMFRYDELGGGKQKEFTQAGVEMLGSGSPEADAEIIATAINALLVSGLENFQIDIGQVEFFKGLMEETGLSDEDAEQIRRLIDKKDYIGVEELVGRHDIKKDLKELIFDLPKLFGTGNIIEKAKSAAPNKKCLSALENLEAVVEILKDYGLEKYISIDLGMVKGLNYYTGIIFKGFTYGIGYPLLSGGRYDNLSELFGRKCPATGFSLGVNMLMMALDRQKIHIEKPSTDSLICYKPKARKTAFDICRKLREQGLVIEMAVGGESVKDASAYACEKGIGGIVEIIDDDAICIHNMETGEKSNISIAEIIESLGK